MIASIFLSHSSKDNEFTRKLAEELSSYGVVVWLDEAELKVGDSLVSKLSSAIDKSDFVGAILSNNSVRSSWVLKELQIAISQEIEGQRVKVLPILIERCEIPKFLADKLYADFTDPNDFDSALLKLLHALGVSEHKPDKKSPIGKLKEKILLILNKDNYKPLTSHGLASRINYSVKDTRLILRLLEKEGLVEAELSGKFLVYKARIRKSD